MQHALLQTGIEVSSLIRSVSKRVFGRTPHSRPYKLVQRKTRAKYSDNTMTSHKGIRLILCSRLIATQVGRHSIFVLKCAIVHFLLLGKIVIVIVVGIVVVVVVVMSTVVVDVVVVDFWMLVTWHDIHCWAIKRNTHRGRRCSFDAAASWPELPTLLEFGRACLPGGGFILSFTLVAMPCDNCRR